MEHLDFEKPIYELVEKLEQARKLGEDTGVEVEDTVAKIEDKLTALKEEVYGNLSAWQRVQISRHPKRPYTLDYINALTEGDFIQLHGDRTVKDDKAMIGGWGSVDGNPVMFIGQQKGRNTKDRQFRNFGMANPEGYRKALRLMRMAEKFNRPVVCLIDTPGAYPGLEAEERGQGEAIARNIYEMAKLKVPIICIIIGEGASGGALGIGVGDRVTMLENSWYSVISPENCSTILWRSWSYKEQAAEALKLTSENMKANKLVDHVLPEPQGGAHYNREEVFSTVKTYIISELEILKNTPTSELVEQRIEKFCSMGVFEE